jgi:toxin ParE1/3/4
MRVVYHPAVQGDVNRILDYYEEISPRLADEFWAELLSMISSIADNPGRGHLSLNGLRRVNFPRFPYNVLFRPFPATIRVIAVRHNKRHPKTGLRRR